MTDPAHTVLSGHAFLEAPRWHDGRIWCSDFYTGQVVSASEDGSDVRLEAEVPGQPSGLGWLPDGRLLVVSMRDRRILRREEDGTLVVHADLSEQATGHLNDMAVDAAGRAYVGNFGFDLMNGAPLETAALHRVDPDGTVTEVAEGLWFPNGSAITPGSVLLVNETFGNRISAFDLTDDGRLLNGRVWAEFGPLPVDRSIDRILAEATVSGDGGCLDAEGGFWCADATGGRLLRVVEGGEVTEELRLDTNVYACALGGADGRTLFACVAPDFHEAARRSERAARLLAFRVLVPSA
jgi:sugar lactone lactonase YvrE